MNRLEEILAEYLRVLEQHGSPTPKVVATQDSTIDWNALDFPSEVTPFDDLKIYFHCINGYDFTACGKQGLIEPELAWGMSALSLEQSLEQYESFGAAEDPDHWPRGFLPVLVVNNTNFVLVNCLADSPTYGAVYDMDENIGCCRVASSLAEFFQAATREIQNGLRRCLPDGFTLTTREYLDDAAPLYGESPYFVRPTHDGPIVDWRPGAAPKLPKTRGRRIPPGVPPNANAVRWAEIAGVPPPTDTGGYGLRLSTAPVEHWYFSQSKLTPDTVNIEAGISYNGWSVKLTRHDRLFGVDWRNGAPPRVDSTQMKYSRLTRWPGLDAIESFPQLVKALEGVLGIRFLPYADFTFPEGESRKILDNPRLLAWLSPCAAQVGRYIGSK